MDFPGWQLAADKVIRDRYSQPVVVCGKARVMDQQLWLLTWRRLSAGPSGGARDGARVQGRAVVSAVLLGMCGWMLVSQGGCSTLGGRYGRDDVVLARQIARQGADAFHSGDWKRAERYYSEAVDVCAVDERVRARYAETLWNLGRREAAIQHQKEAVRLSGDAPELKVRLGEMYLAQGDLHRAHQLVQRAIESGRESAVAYRLQGDILQQQGKWREALASYHRALSIQPDYPEVRMAVARGYQLEGRPQRALATLHALADTYPPGEEPAELHYWQGVALAALGRHSRAVRHLATAESRGLHGADLLFRLANSHYLAGEHRAARTVLDRAMQLDPHHPHATRLRGVLDERPRVAEVRE
ncbi:MAG: tetratricopeptide repeat protein [Planctomycetota bacterium]